MGKPSKVRVTGPLERFADGFRRELAGWGYRPNAACSQLRLMAHLSRWMDNECVEVDELTSPRVDEFLAHRRGEGYTLCLSRKALVPLLGHLRELGEVPMGTPESPVGEVEGLLAAYESFLVSERGLAQSTTAGYVSVARLFLEARAATVDHDGVALETLTAEQVTGFVLSECSSRSVGSAKCVVCGLRSLLRWAYLVGLVDAELDPAVPSVTGWRLTGVPVSFGPDEVERLLASCDRRSRFGRRDYAVLCLLARLGMRSGEVAALELGDIDWHAGEIIVRGKGPKAERLPLPADVGDAVAGWVQRGRPRCESSAVITRVRAPHGPLSPGGVSHIVASACRRAGLPVGHAHRLRHAAATAMLAAGGSLTEVGQVLRHASMLTTAIYAKVDYDRLAALARPWPSLEVER